MLPKEVFDFIEQTMKQILDNSLDDNYITGELEQYFEILQMKICQRPFWKKNGIWSEIINYNIETEKVKQKVAEEKN